ncbi:BZ3500_MvSof-1268-A1-R1_Chr4-2g06956 [Microbotryum saponariae]|uniref:BZ3500_MvSof-1268-A1-R1_Chr4-2g06956 protein n=1 Tax=Microbotryum saponariae TaxID=289078 RepID=A0A2X0LHY6_9BASI|nr:BZ3500_MvSof-1268-A1-R1_Chr4-2g06956 [Microbotryum saponariae]SDA06621.1 BZ3501_MvSof-1269-A2-R1_Chr4-2g06667 [Microbotryum saponariae]
MPPSMTVKHGHDCLGYALDAVPDALLSRKTNLSSALVSLVGRSSSSEPQPIATPGRSVAALH